MRTSMAVAGATLFLSLSGCQLFNPDPPNYQSIEYVRERLDSSEFQAAPMPEHLRWWHEVLWFVPNRLLDIPDILKLNVGLGFGQGLEVSVTEHAQMYWRNYRRWGLGMDGRALGVFEDGRFREGRFFKWRRATSAGGLRPIFAQPNLRPYEYPDQQGVAAVQEVPQNPWEIGVLVHLIAGAEVRVRPHEIVDLVFGLWNEDPAEDDHGTRDYPIHDYPVQGNVMDMFLAAVDQLNEADLNAVLSRELAATARVARGGGLKPLDMTGAASSPAEGSSDEAIAVGEALIYPARYRSGGGRLEAVAECTECVLRWGVPAQITYRLRLFNQLLQKEEVYKVVLEHEDGQWKILRIKDLKDLPAGG